MRGCQQFQPVPPPLFTFEIVKWRSAFLQVQNGCGTNFSNASEATMLSAKGWTVDMVASLKNLNKREKSNVGLFSLPVHDVGDGGDVTRMLVTNEAYKVIPEVSWLLACPECRDHTIKNSKVAHAMARAQETSSEPWSINQDTPSARCWRMLTDRLAHDQKTRVWSGENVGGMLRQFSLPDGSKTDAVTLVSEHIRKKTRFEPGHFVSNPAHDVGAPIPRRRVLFTALSNAFGTRDERSQLLGQVELKYNRFAGKHGALAFTLRDVLLPKYDWWVMKAETERERALKKTLTAGDDVHAELGGCNARTPAKPAAKRRRKVDSAAKPAAKRRRKVDSAVEVVPWPTKHEIAYNNAGIPWYADVRDNPVFRRYSGNTWFKSLPPREQDCICFWVAKYDMEMCDLKSTDYVEVSLDLFHGLKCYAWPVASG